MTRPATISSYRKDDVYYPRFTLRSTELRDAGFAACDTVWLVVYEHYIELAAQLPASTDGIQRATQHEISPYQSGARIVIGAEDLQPGGFSIGDEVQVDVQTGLLAIEWIAAGAVREKELPLLENVKGWCLMDDRMGNLYQTKEVGIFQGVPEDHLKIDIRRSEE